MRSVPGIALFLFAGSFVQAQDPTEATRSLFEAYEREDVARFLGALDPDLVMSDDTGNAYRLADLPRALADDFAILDRVRFEATAGPFRIDRERSRASVRIRWSRRALTEIGGREWIVRARRSVLEFRRDPHGEWRLVRLHGHAPFALADRAGRIVVRDGTLDGRPVEEPVVLDRSGP